MLCRRKEDGEKGIGNCGTSGIRFGSSQARMSLECGKARVAQPTQPAKPEMETIARRRSEEIKEGRE